MFTLGWTDEQNRIVSDLIAGEIEKARLAHKFLPEMRVDEGVRSVPADAFDAATNRVDDAAILIVTELAVPVNLTKVQAEDSDLSAALFLIGRAANQLARTHDIVVFQGQPAPNTLPGTPGTPGGPPPLATAIGGAANPGLNIRINPVIDIGPAPPPHGELLVAGVADALVRQETAGYVGDYVLILGQNLFIDANTPSPGSLVLPKDRIEELLGGGPVYRSTALVDDNAGILLCGGGDPVVQVMSVDPRFEFMRIAPNEIRECRVFERGVLKVLDGLSVQLFNRVP